MHKIKYVDPKAPDKVLMASGVTRGRYSLPTVNSAEVKADLLRKGFKLVGKRQR